MSYRVITDDVPVSTSLNQLSHLAERLYFRLLSQTDPWGRLPGELVKIRDLCIPRLAVTDTELAGALEELTIAGRITLYCADGVWACQLVDFDRHQPIAKLKRGRSRWPAPPQTPVAPDTQTDTAARGEAPSDSQPPATETGTLIEKSLQNQRSAETRTDDRRRDFPGSPTAVAQYVGGLPDFKSGKASGTPAVNGLCFAGRDLGEIARGLRGADAGTPAALASVLRGMPEAALASALKGLDLRRGKQHLGPIRNEARWLVGTIQTMRLEGEYQAAG